MNQNLRTQGQGEQAEACLGELQKKKKNKHKENKKTKGGGWHLSIIGEEDREKRGRWERRAGPRSKNRALHPQTT